MHIKACLCIILKSVHSMNVFGFGVCVSLSFTITVKEARGRELSSSKSGCAQ